MVNLITRMVSMEIVWTLYGDCMDSDTFHGTLLVRLKWRLYGNSIYHVFSTKPKTFSRLILP